MTAAARKAPLDMTVDVFLDWSDTRPETERYELVNGEPILLARDRIKHNQTKVRAFDALRATYQNLDDYAVFIDGIAVSKGPNNYRLPDVVVHQGDYDPESSMAGMPIVLVEVVSKSSEERDVHAKLRDYFAIESVQHYLIIYGDERYLVHHRRLGEGHIDTRIVTSGPIELNPPGIRIESAAFFERQMK